MIVQRKDDYRIYVEDDNKNYLSTAFINKSLEGVNKTIDVYFNLKTDSFLDDKEITISLTKEQIVIMSNLLNECKNLL